MAFNPMMTRLVASILDDLEADPTVVEIGNQTFKPGARTLGEVTTALRANPRTDPDRLAALGRLDAEALRPKTEEYYRALGFTDYKAIDVNDNYGSLVMDLNKDLAQAYGYRDTFSLVTNNGTGEHVFNQQTVFENIHNLTKNGGFMIHLLPLMYYVNHGFYSFHPGLFFDLAAANGYRIHAAGLSERNAKRVVVARGMAEAASSATRHLLGGRTIDLAALRAKPKFGAVRLSGRLLLAAKWLAGVASRGRPPARSPRVELARALHYVVNGSGNAQVFAVLQKTSEQAFQFPFQGRYTDVIDDGRIREDYVAQAG